MDDDDLYDEFGNYIGPELKPEQEIQSQNEELEHESQMEDIFIEEKKIDEVEDRIVLHEEKQYYPEMDELYPGAENLVMEEDMQQIYEPIISPVKSKDFDTCEAKIPDTTFSYEYMQDLMKFPDLIRNVGIVGHLHHGKTSLIDLFVKETHLKDWKLNKEYRYTDYRKDEQERLISIKSKPMSLILPTTSGKSYLINIFDTPGHVNFSDEICCALRICDGVVLVVDAIEGVMLGTDRLIAYLVQQKIAITVFINKIDRLIIEMKLPPQDAYLKLRHTLEEINNLIIQNAGNISEEELSKLKISPLLGNVVFGSSFYNFAFSLESYAEMYGYSYKFDKAILQKVLWGNYYYDRVNRRFITKPTKEFAKRTFVEFILEPIYKIFSHTVSKDRNDLKPILNQLGVYLKQHEFKIDTKPLLILIFKRLFGKTNTVVDMIVKHIPSALVAIKKKVELNYTGSRDNEYYPLILKCDSNGPLVVNIVKQFNRPDCLTFDAFGCVISGTLKKSDMVKVLGQNYNVEDEEDMALKQVKSIYIFQSRYKIEINQAYAGNWVLIEGIEQSIVKSATIISANEKFKFEILRPIKFNTTSVVKVAIEPLIPSELPKMLEGLRKVNKSYPLLVTKVEESGEHILIGTGELYMDCVLHDLRRMYSEIEIKVSDPSVCLCETVIETSSIKCYAETPNKKNKLTMISSPLEKQIGDDIENEKIDMAWGKKITSKFFQENYQWDLISSRSVWSFGPTQFGSNILIDDTLPSEVDKQLLQSCSETIIQGFKWATREGPLCDEPIRNVKFRIIEAEISSEVLYRGGGQIIPTARRTCYSSFLMATPRIMEPQFFVEIQCTQDALEAVYIVIGRRRGHILQESAKAGSPLYTVKANIPTIDSFGFETDLRVHTSGQAFCLQVFDHWEMLPGDPLDKNIKLNLLEPAPPQDLAREFMIKTRRRKGLNENVSIVKYFDDQDLLEQLKQDQDFKDYI